MRVLDLLQLLSDYNKNTPVRVKVAGALENIESFELQLVDEQRQLWIHAKPAGKPLKVWEVMMLLDKPEWRQAFVHVIEPDDIRPLFGFQDTDLCLALN
ncbi:hypothetical protein [Lacticaseibacillus porcinae]|uniref:hypothetical protein n=1 Tax=Lacticaseibacillus porcinae TaxID=1123687 RepID=UPI000F7BB124|nr:hypothetical protein [Lacticaseibacillus porcinae]